MIILINISSQHFQIDTLSFPLIFLITDSVNSCCSRLNDFQSLRRRCGPIHNYNFLMCCICWRKFNFMLKWLCPLQWNVERHPIHLHEKDKALPMWKLTNLVYIYTFYTIQKYLVPTFLLYLWQNKCEKTLFIILLYMVSFYLTFLMSTEVIEKINIQFFEFIDL